MTFCIKGIKFKIDFVFLIIGLLAALGGLYIEIIGALMALIIHEMGHLICGHVLGLLIEKVELLPFGGKMTLRNLEQASIESELATILSGPMANFVFYFFLLFLIGQDIVATDIAHILVKYQLTLGLFNMIPALPLDGGRVFMLWLRNHINYINAARIASKMGMILSGVLWFIVILGIFYKKYYINVIIISVFLFLESYKEYREAPLLFIKELIKKKKNLKDKGYMTIEPVVSMETTPVKNIFYLFSPKKYHVVYVLNENANIIRCFTETEIFNKIVEEGLDIRMKDLL